MAEQKTTVFSLSDSNSDWNGAEWKTENDPVGVWDNKDGATNYAFASKEKTTETIFLSFPSHDSKVP